MNYYIFLTNEGHTLQLNSSSQEEDIHNLQVLGIAKGLSQEEAFYNLLASNPHLNETSFNEVFCYQLVDNYEETRKDFFLKLGI